MDFFHRGYSIVSRWCAVLGFIIRGRLTIDFRRPKVYLHAGSIALRRCISTTGPLIVRPIQVVLGLSLACNNRCIFCLAHSPLVAHEDGQGNKPWFPEGVGTKDLFMSLELLNKVVAGIAEILPQEINLSGQGETLLYPDLERALGLIHASRTLHGIRLRLTTNGILLHQKNAELLHRYRADTVEISLNAASAETYADMHGSSPATFQLIVDQVRALVSLCPCTRILVTFVVSKQNYRELPKMVRLCEQMGVKEAGFWPLYMCREKQKNIEKYIFSREDRAALEASISEAYQQARGHGIQTNLVFFLKKIQETSSKGFVPGLTSAYSVQIHANGVVNPYDFPLMVGTCARDSLTKL